MRVAFYVHSLSRLPTRQLDEASSIGDDGGRGFIAGAAGGNVDPAVVYPDGHPQAVHVEVVGLAPIASRLGAECHFQTEQKGTVG